MVIVVNGKNMNTAEHTKLSAVLRENGIDETKDGVAVAVNSAVVPRRNWDDVHLSDGDTVEVIHAVQGG